MTIFLWKCTKCHHEWQATVNAGAICEWCGEDGSVLGEEVVYTPLPYRDLSVDNVVKLMEIPDVPSKKDSEQPTD